jgi:hypothetical protein
MTYSHKQNELSPEAILETFKLLGLDNLCGQENSNNFYKDEMKNDSKEMKVITSDNTLALDRRGPNA